MIKRMVFGAVALLTASLLISQSLADLSKQEKERREKLKGKSVRVITNRDLKPSSKAGAVDAAPPEAAASLVEGQGAPAAGETGAAEAETAPGPPEDAPAQDLPGFATSVSSESLLVDNPGLAVGPPDGRFAEISVSGILDLEIDVNNGPGADLAVYATPPAKQIPDEESEDQLEAEQAAMWWGQFAYAVLGLDARGDWLEVGMGSGRSPDTFDLGALKSTTRILIMFKAYSNPYNQGPKPMRLSGREMTFGVDAVRALH